MMENTNWSSIAGNTSEAPYINSLVTGSNNSQTSYATQYDNPPGNHPSLPNYLWLDAGQCFTYCGTDNPPSASPNGISATATLHHLLSAAGISWTEYAEGITDGSCPLNDSYPYAAKHDPFVYFNDVSGSSACTTHEKSFGDLAGDLAGNTVARYNVITPNLCDDMHDSCAPTNDAIKQGDSWLQSTLPTILGSQAYQHGGAVFITWDEGEGGDGPIGMLALSPLAKGHGYANAIHYTHSSTLRTMEELYGVSPFLGDAANATDLADLFVAGAIPTSGTAATPTPTPTATPTPTPAPTPTATPTGTVTSSPSSSGWVTRQGSSLLLGGQPFRFSGANIYWLGLDENDGGIGYPTHFRIDDALRTAVDLGATVVRSHTLGISVGTSLSVEPALNQFNDAAFASMDYAIERAGQLGLHLIIPLTDGNTPCFYHGCIRTFVDWVYPGSTNDGLFFSDGSVISAFEAYLSHLLNHVNQYTGIAYKNDPTIMAWESGNELDDGTSTTTTWLSTISSYLKSIDPQHLVMDGGWTMDASRLALPNVDLYTRHHYNNGWYYPGGSGTAISDDDYYGCQAAAAGKVYIVGEYDWTEQNGAPLQLATYLPNVQTATCSSGVHAVTGDLYWSLFGHLDSYGFEQHTDGYTLHYGGDAGWMRTQTQALRQHAFAMQGRTVPAAPLLTAPAVQVTAVPGGMQLSWQGVAGAAYYLVQRSLDGVSWTTISPLSSPADGTLGGLTDNDTPWIDPTGTLLDHYRVLAVNQDGVPSS
jgi:hypothetical protein